QTCALPILFVSDITPTITDTGQPVPNLPVEVWNVDSCLAKLTTDKKGMFKISAPATIDVRFATPDGKQHQQWLFYEYPPLLDVMEYVYTLQDRKSTRLNSSHVKISYAV